jgi:hypothetical protein
MSKPDERDAFERMVDRVLAYRPKKKEKKKRKRKTSHGKGKNVKTSQ